MRRCTVSERKGGRKRETDRRREDVREPGRVRGEITKEVCQQHSCNQQQ